MTPPKACCFRPSRRCHDTPLKNSNVLETSLLLSVRRSHGILGSPARSVCRFSDARGGDALGVGRRSILQARGDRGGRRGRSARSAGDCGGAKKRGRGENVESGGFPHVFRFQLIVDV